MILTVKRPIGWPTAVLALNEARFIQRPFSLSDPEVLLDFAEGVGEPVHFIGRVVEIKTGAGSGFQAQLVHEGLVAVMSAPQRDAGLIGQGDQVVRMDVVQDKAQHARAILAGAEDADAFEAGKPFIGIGGQFLVVVRNLIAPNVIQVVHGSGQGDGAGDVGSAGFEAMGRLFPGALLVTHRFDHVAAALPGGHGHEAFQAAVKHPDASRAAHFVAAEGEKVTADLLDVQGPMPRTLGGVHQRDDAALAGAGTQLGDRVDRAERVRDMGEGKEFNIGGTPFIQQVLITVVFDAGCA